MKKIKFMLLSLALFAVVGGTLAFKAKFNQTWCSTKAVKVGSNYVCALCPDLAITLTTTNNIAHAIQQTTWCSTDPYIDAFDQPTCTTLIGSNVTTTQCVTPTLLKVDN